MALLIGVLADRARALKCQSSTIDSHLASSHAPSSSSSKRSNERVGVEVLMEDDEMEEDHGGFPISSTILYRLKQIIQYIVHTIVYPFYRAMPKDRSCPGSAEGAPNTVPSDLTWGGIRITQTERYSVLEMKNRLATNLLTNHNIPEPNGWIKTVKDLEILRFLRQHNQNKDEAFKHMLIHNQWRRSKYGRDNIDDVDKRLNFAGSPMNNEVFWLGPDKGGCPTLVVRTQLHDGVYYNEDPQLFVAFLVHILEKGRKLYGFGDKHQLCLLLDRSNIDFNPMPGGGTKEDKMGDMSVLPNLVKLFQHLTSTLGANYPDALAEVRIFPSSWWFSVCYKVLSRIFDAKTRNSIKVIKDRDVPQVMKMHYEAALIPSHLGGHPTTTYPIINFNRASAASAGSLTTVSGAVKAFFSEAESLWEQYFV